MNKKINLAFINYSVGTGGIETLILEICKRLDNKRFKLFMIVFEESGALLKEFEDAEVKIIYINKKRASMSALGRSLQLVYRALVGYFLMLLTSG